MMREQLREETGRPVLAGDVVSVRHMCGAAVACISEATNAGPTGPGPTNGGRVPMADQLFQGAAIAAGVWGVPRRLVQAEWEKNQLNRPGG